MKGGFEDSEPVDMVLRTMQGGEPDLAEFEGQLSAGSGALQVLLLRLCLGNVLGNPSWLMLKLGQQRCLNLSSMDNQFVRAQVPCLPYAQQYRYSSYILPLS